MDSTRTDTYFLPHRAVYDLLRISTKCRVVFDASAKTKSGKSLNDCLLPGPPLQQKIAAVELRFRRRPVALIGDCKKMFLQVQVDPADRPFLRFLWIDPQDPTATLKVYQFKTLIFGATDSPFQAISCFQRLVTQLKGRGNLTNIEKRVCETILRDTYVDDITTGGESAVDAFNMYQGVTNLLAGANFEIHKWATNSSELLNKIPEKDRAPTRAMETGELLESEDTASLGVRWDPREDVLIFKRYADIGKSNEDTKTSVASLLARPFDPLGLIGPFILLARGILKQTFQDNLGWKAKLSGSLLGEWQQWLALLPELLHVKFPRHTPFNKNTEIHVFGDASSNLGHGVAAYSRTFQKDNGKFSCNLLFAKSKINPIKELSVPRLELIAALLAAEVADMIEKEMDIPHEKIFCYSDSETVLWWLTKPPNTLLPFVANRVTKVTDFGFPFQYVNTAVNPADIASRGCEPSELMDPLWQQGPPFLRLPNAEWELPKVDFTKVNKLIEVKKQHVFAFASLAMTTGKREKAEIFDLEDFYGDHEN